MFHSALRPLISALLLPLTLLIIGCGYSLTLKADITTTSNLQKQPFALATAAHTTSTTEAFTTSGQDDLPLPGQPAPTP